MSRRMIVILASIWMVIVVACASSAATVAAMGGGYTASAAAPNKYQRLDDILEIIKDTYYVDVDEAELIEGAVRGLFSSLDEYSFYYSPEEMDAMMEQSSGKYYGIGVLITMDGEGGISIVRVYEGPAREAGLVSGDRIIAIEGEYLNVQTSQDLTAATERITAEMPEPVRLTINRGGEVFDIDVMRAEVEANRTRHAILDNGIGYLEISEFMGDDVTGVQKALEYFQENGVEKMVLDMRSNSGGDFYHALQIADMFLDECVIVELIDRAGNTETYRAEKGSDDITFVILVNELSASATEIVAGAMQDHGRAVIMGVKTFGKGIVQDVISFRDTGEGLQITSAQYYTPNGNAVHGIGITPDIVVELDENYDPSIYDIDLENDNQLREAVKYLESLQK